MNRVIRAAMAMIMAITMPLAVMGQAQAASFSVPAPTGLTMPSDEAPTTVGRRGGRAAAAIIGLGALAIGAAIASRRARAYDRGDYYYYSAPRRESHRSYCSRMLYKCEHGSRWACREFDYNC